VGKTSGKHAFGFCDRTGFRYPLDQLVEEYENGVPTGLLVGYDMVDPDHPQLHLDDLGDISDDMSLPNPRPDLTILESRRMFSFNPVGMGNMLMKVSVGKVIATVS
jgi:hypothetical protein